MIYVSVYFGFLAAHLLFIDHNVSIYLFTRFGL